MPKKRKMVKTSEAYCKKCTYCSGLSSADWCCMYYPITGNRRGCEIGECDKFEKRRPGDEEIHRRLWQDGQFAKDLLIKTG